MASASTTINANLKINQPSVKSAQRTVQSAFNNINLNSKNVSQFSNSLGRITGQASEFRKSMDAATARVFAFGATAAVINGISQSFKALVASTIDVEKRLIEINSIFGATEKQFASFRKSIFEVAKNTGQSFAVVADGAAELARQGLSAEETAKRLNASLILTRVSGLDAVSSVNSLTAALNGFTSAGLTAESVVNKIIAVDTAFAVSAKDLAEGFQRAGSTAEDAGVSFDELLGLITAVQQKTARGGAVIGNAFKSIFTRLSRGTTISELQQLGVEIDASQSGVQKLQALSLALEKVGDPNVASKIKELAGGVFQINVVSAALKDLSSETSIFADAASKSAAASNEAFSKNESLNKSLSAQINALVVGATNLAEKIGQITLSPILTDLTSLATKFTDFLSSSLDEDSGNKFIKGFFQGISSFISGPGVILVTTAFLNIFKIVARFAKEGFQDLLRLGSGQERVKNIEAGIVQLLGQDEALRNKIASTTVTQAQKERLIIQAIEKENALLRQQQAIIAQLASGAARAGITGFGAGKGFSGKGGRGRASGFMPIEGAMEVAEARSLGARGAVRPKLSQGTIGGRKFVMNSQETEIPNFGRNGDSAVIPNYAKGFVPNFKRRGAPSNQPRVDESTTVEELEKLSDTRLKALSSNFPNAKKALERKKAGKTPLGSESNRININASQFGFLIPKIGAKQSPPKRGHFTTPTGKIFFDMKGVNVRGPILPRNVGKVQDPEAADLEEAIKGSMVEKATKFAKVLKGPSTKPSKESVKKRLEEQKGGLGAIGGAVGAAFEAGVATALGVKEIDITKEQGDFDLRSTDSEGLNPDIFALFGIKPFALGEFKSSASPTNLNSFARKIVKETTGKSFDLKGRKNFPIAAKAAGFIPNFANPLGEAISRETSGTGISKSQVRISNDKRLVNKSNPSGLAVTNTRDEPNGLKDVFASGFVPNFAPKPQGSGSNASVGAALGLGLSFLSPVLTELIGANTEAAITSKQLSKEIEKLEQVLSKLDNETEKVKIEKLTEKIEKLKKSQQIASKAAQDFNNQLILGVNSVSAFATVIALLPHKFKLASLGIAAVVASLLLAQKLNRDQRAAFLEKQGKIGPESSNDLQVIREFNKNLLVSDNSSVLDKILAAIRLIDPTEIIIANEAKTNNDPFLQASKELNERIDSIQREELGGTGAFADVVGLNNRFKLLSSRIQELSGNVESAGGVFVSAFQSVSEGKRFFDDNVFGGIDSQIQLAQKASKLDTTLGDDPSASKKRASIEDQRTANINVATKDLDKTFLDVRGSIQSVSDKQAASAGLSSSFDTLNLDPRKDIQNILNSLVATVASSEKVADAMEGTSINDGTTPELFKVRDIIEGFADTLSGNEFFGDTKIPANLLSPDFIRKELINTFSKESIGGFAPTKNVDNGGISFFIDSAVDALKKIGGEETQAIVDSNKEANNAVDTMLKIVEKQESGKLTSEDMEAFLSAKDVLFDFGALTEDTLQEFDSDIASFFGKVDTANTAAIIENKKITIDELKTRKNLNDELIKTIQTNFGENLKNTEDFVLEKGGLGEFEGREIKAFSSDFFKFLKDRGLEDRKAEEAIALIGGDTIDQFAASIKQGSGTELDKQIDLLSLGVDKTFTANQQKQLGLVGENFSLDEFKKLSDFATDEDSGISDPARGIIQTALGDVAKLDTALDNITDKESLVNVQELFDTAFDSLGAIDSEGNEGLVGAVVAGITRLFVKQEGLEDASSTALATNLTEAQELDNAFLKASADAEKQEPLRAGEKASDVSSQRLQFDTTPKEGLGEGLKVGDVLQGAALEIKAFAKKINDEANALGIDVIGEEIGTVANDLKTLGEAGQTAANALSELGGGEDGQENPLTQAQAALQEAMSALTETIIAEKDKLEGIDRIKPK